MTISRNFNYDNVAAPGRRHLCVAPSAAAHMELTAGRAGGRSGVKIGNKALKCSRILSLISFLGQSSYIYAV